MEYVKQVYQVELLNLRTGIKWWDDNRRIINVVIHEFNKYQLGQSNYNGNAIVDMILDAIKYGADNDFACWQNELLNEMLQVLYVS